MTSGKTVKLVILGCPKNRADAEALAGVLIESGFILSEDSGPADAAVLLTCGFVKDAEEEAVEHILALAGEKRNGKIGALIVTGCLPQRHRHEDVAADLPEVDAWIGAADYPRIGEIVAEALHGDKVHRVSPAAGFLPGKGRRVKLGREPYAYLKISEGCRNRCAYCAIPAIRGDFRSRPMANIVKEAIELADSGAMEITLVAQDTAMYGRDIYGKPALATLMKNLARRLPDAWLRVMYLHPAHITDALLDVMAAYGNICPYLDAPIQHAATSVLRRMGRPGSKTMLRRLFRKIRRVIPGAALRTTVMVGFPGETAAEFGQLMDFIEEIRFDRLGAFPYSREENTAAYGIPRQIRENIKQKRLDKIMGLQQEIAWDIQQDWVGREMDVLVDGPASDRPGWTLARSMWHAPEVDSGVYIETADREPGERLRVKIIDALPYDLEGEIIG